MRVISEELKRNSSLIALDLSGERTEDRERKEKSE